jgi:peptidyl-prolyl cis-trans isomerase A (cyclophilin A)
MTRIAAVAFALLLGAACTGSTPEAPPPAETKTEVAKSTPKPAPEKVEEKKPEPAKVALPEATEALLNPAGAGEEAPATYKVKFETTKGDVVILVHRDWAPKGADRFYNLVKIGYFKDIAAFRVINNFMAQFGIHGNPKVASAWKNAKIQDDEVKESNTRGRITFATAGPNTRTTQLFINYKDNSNLDGMGFAPFGEVVEGMEIVDSWYKGYGEGAPRGKGPMQGRVQAQGNQYLKTDFPELDYIKSASLL